MLKSPFYLKTESQKEKKECILPSKVIKFKRIPLNIRVLHTG